jgi:hypothetical protein
MPTNTYTPIASVTLSASASEVVFSGLPQTFRDLIIVARMIPTANNFPFVRFNADSGANYNRVVMAGQGSGSGTSFATANQNALDVGAIVTSASTFIYQIMDYSATDKHKTVLLRMNSADVSANQPVAAGAYRWASNSAINTIQFYPDANAYATGTTFTVFGVIA